MKLHRMLGFRCNNGKGNPVEGFDSYLAIAVAFFIVTVSPGPANIAVATVAMHSGRRPGLLFGLGLSVGLAFWGMVAATGLGVILQSTTTLLTLLKLLGGAYLLWLAIQSGRSAAQSNAEMQVRTTTGRWFWRGLLLNLSNPKAVVAWMAALSMGLGQDTGPYAVAVATLFCISLGVVNYAGYALTFSLPGFMAGYRRSRRWIEGVVAGLFALAGFGLIRSALTR
ncbi:LysE family translocator [Hoeflea sp.]|uniref:LysE family translocator n=1 Tax=Hoeflea sp. TaxID=1940281 RepID=UPI003747B687